MEEYYLSNSDDKRGYYLIWLIRSLDFMLEIHRDKAPPKSRERGLLSDMAFLLFFYE